MRELIPERAVYKIEQAMGASESATVFRAIREDSRGHSQQTVALKILTSPNAIPWLKREFETLARLDSPHCVRILGWENLDQGCALVLEWVEGATLLELGRSVELKKDEIEEILAQVQLGLTALHEKRLHHGDLSPTNILVDCEGRVRLVDFATSISTDETLRGTPAYMAPELWSGALAGPQADLFALGLIAMDLRSGFRNVPVQLEDCRRRAEKAVGQSPLNMANESSRRMLKLSADENRQKRLAESVTHFLKHKASQTFRTQTFSVPNCETVTGSRSFRRFALCVCMLIFISTAPVRAHAPLVSINALSAELSIRAQNWIEISLNGKRLGFAPIERLRLSPGEHRISWRTKKMFGDRKILVAAGETLRLTDEHLISNALPVNR